MNDAANRMTIVPPIDGDNTSSTCRWKAVLRGTMKEVSSRGLQYRSHHNDQDAPEIVPPHSSDPIKATAERRSRREARTRERRYTPAKRKALDKR